MRVGARVGVRVRVGVRHTLLNSGVEASIEPPNHTAKRCVWLGLGLGLGLGVRVRVRARARARADLHVVRDHVDLDGHGLELACGVRHGAEWLGGGVGVGVGEFLCMVYSR